MVVAATILPEGEAMFLSLILSSTLLASPVKAADEVWDAWFHRGVEKLYVMGKIEIPKGHQAKLVPTKGQAKVLTLELVVTKVREVQVPGKRKVTVRHSVPDYALGSYEKVVIVHGDKVVELTIGVEG
jgi:hypothetical protein